MTKDEMATATKALALLFSSFPQSATANVDMQIRAYLDALKECHVDDILNGVKRFRLGDVPGYDGAFCPSTAQLSKEIRLHKSVREASDRKHLRLVAGKQ